MGTASEESFLPEFSEGPTSVFLHGPSRPLLNWVLYALLVRTGRVFQWTDVRLRGEVLDPMDPLARRLVPESQLSIVLPEELNLSDPPSRTMPEMIHPDEPADSMRRVNAFLRLPGHTQEVLSRVTGEGTVTPVGLSNCHRLAAAFPADAIQPTLRAFMESGASIALTWADAVPASARAFDFVIGVEGRGPLDWKEARLRCDIGNSTGVIRAGQVLRLGDVPAIAEVIEPAGLVQD
ncbi:MAG TPA: hypothetical protein VK455_02165 [Thermoplasmata archaeon]|nr:hypothetical protein [Thermoplasmata archaeon]